MPDSKGWVGAYTSIALDSYGNPHISYQGANGSNSTLKYASWNGNSWKFETVDSSDYREGSYTCLSLDSKGYPHISYDEDRTSQLKYAYWNGTGWTIEAVDEPGNAGNYNSLALDSQGNPCIAYHRGGSGLEGSLKYAHWTGEAWTIETVDSGAQGMNPVNAGQCCSLSLDSADRPHILYIGGGTSGLAYASWTGSSWDIKKVTAGGVSIGSQLVFGSHLLALDSQDNPHIVYNVHNWGSVSENTTNRPWYASWNGTDWTTEQVDSKAQNCYAESLVLDRSDNPYIAYSDTRPDPANWMNTVNHLELATRSGAGWSVQEVDGTCADYPCIAIDSGGNPHISYCDTVSNFRMKYAVLAENCQVGFSQSGLGALNENVLRVDSNDFKSGDLPLTFTWNKGTNHVFSYISLLNTGAGQRYVWTETSGLSTVQSGTLPIACSGNVSAQYQLQPQISFSVNAKTDNGSTVDLAISGNVTSSQMSNFTIAANQYAATTAVSFTLTGENGATGFGNVTIPKSSVIYGKTPLLYIDGQQAANQGYAQDANNYYVWFTTHFSTHEVSIVFTPALSSPTPTVPEFPLVAIAMAIIIETTAAMFFRTKKQSYKS